MKELLLSLKIVFFGGKGGVGKTTSASSAAIWAAEHGRNTLIISTDPAHSLGDSLGQELPPGEPTPVKGVKNLTALEINPKVEMAELQGLTNLNPMEDLNMGGGVMGDMMEGMMKGIMGEEDGLSSMNPPGIDEALAFGKVLEFIETNHDYDLIIFDTAPTGHTLRFLSLPETLSGWIGKILKLRLKMGKMFGAIKRMFSKEEKKEENSLELLEKLNNSIINARDDLVNPLITSFVVVMIPEEMAISETGRLLSELIKYDIHCSNIIINQLYQETEELCDFCRSRRKMQQKNMLKIKAVFQDRLGKNLIEIPLFKGEIREYDSLKDFGKQLFK